MSGYRKVGGLLIATLLAGPKILLLMPVWLLGVAACRRSPRMSERAALLLLILTIGLGLLFFWFDVSVAIRARMSVLWPDFMAALHGSNQFVGDMMLGLIVTANFIAVANLPRLLRVLTTRRREIKLLASFTFSAYLYHMPLFAFFYGVVGLRAPALLLPLLVISIALAGFLTERRTSVLREWLGRLSLGATGERNALRA
jgi:hypothetical protein